MSVSCVGTCSACGVRRFWLSETLSLQLDDASLKCLPHPGESGSCEKEGLTLAQASERGRLYEETFYVCRRCGRDGVLIAPRKYTPYRFPSSSVSGSAFMVKTKIACRAISAGAV
jgi:hypothetical protein